MTRPGVREGPRRGDRGRVFDADPLSLFGRELLRERVAALVAEACAWSVGLSDRPHYRRRQGRLTATGATLGERAAAAQPLGSDEGGRLDLCDARPGSFQDALNALTPDGGLHADRFDDEVLHPFVLDTCLRAAERVREDRPAAWAELLAELGEDDDADPADVVRAGEWEVPLHVVAEHLVLAALGAVPLVEVEAEGLPLALVRAAEALTREAVAGVDAATGREGDDRFAGALFLAEAAVAAAGIDTPVPDAQAGRLLTALQDVGLEDDEITQVLPHLPVPPSTAAKVTGLLADAGPAA